MIDFGAGGRQLSLLCKHMILDSATVHQEDRLESNREARDTRSIDIATLVCLQ